METLEARGSERPVARYLRETSNQRYNIIVVEVDGFFDWFEG